MKYKNVSEYINIHSIENSSKTFGVSEPTIHRWKSKQEFPQSAEIVIQLLNIIDDLENDYNLVRREKIRIEKTVDVFNNAFEDLNNLSK